ncbi:J domain-containing protein [Stakelama sp. CBK3Z-3]|uniref:J domain-containing protein n=1 Tax=Stakelama flava TaxID=2860338 RepID=A0ABS6XNS7_9SPHN|nr:J domain-containing protein [Stakelama flava]MBW4331872.1 J domain-containing protein [Stakelama flava]
MAKLIFVALIFAALWLLMRKGKAERLKLPADEAEARSVLGVGRDAGRDEIRAAHRRQVARVHPDRGGSAEATRRINAARDLLIGRTSD